MFPASSIMFLSLMLTHDGQPDIEYFRQVAEARSEVKSWPAGLERPLGFRKYQRARYTQAIAVTSGFDSIDPVRRDRQEEKYVVPGGLVGVTGWKSDLYVKRGQHYDQWVGNIPVWNGSNYQFNRGWKRNFYDGAEFMDVLTNTDTGKVFEIRMAVNGTALIGGTVRSGRKVIARCVLPIAGRAMPIPAQATTRLDWPLVVTPCSHSLLRR